MKRDKSDSHFFLTGQKVRMSPLSAAEYSEAYVSWFNDPVTCRDNRHGDSLYTEKQMQEYVKTVSASDNDIAFAIRLMPDNKHVGNVTLNDISWRHGTAEVSILIGEQSVWGCGIGADACRAVVNYAFNQIKLRCLRMEMLTRNQPMIRIAESLDFCLEGIRRQAFFKNGEYLDIALYGLLNNPEERARSGRVALLMKYGNVMGLEYLRSFRQNRIPVEAVIFQGDTYAPGDRKILMDRTGGRYRPLSLGEVLEGSNVRTYFVDKHNSSQCLGILDRLKPDVIVLGGTDIVEQTILSTSGQGVLNCHPGMLPQYRGCSCVEWAIYYGDLVGATCHKATSRIDSGPIIYQEPMKIFRSDSYEDIRARMIEHQTRVMTKGLEFFLAKSVEWNEPVEKGRYHPVIGDSELREVMKKIYDKTYPHMAPNVV